MVTETLNQLEEEFECFICSYSLPSLDGQLYNVFSRQGLILESLAQVIGNFQDPIYKALVQKATSAISALILSKAAILLGKNLISLLISKAVSSSVVIVNTDNTKMHGNPHYAINC